MTSKNLIDELTAIGLTENESKVYISCLESGQSTPSQISRLTKIKRSTLYLILDSLHSLGLISSTVKKKNRLVTALRPTKLLKILSDKEEVARKNKLQLKKILPKLTNLQITKPSTTGLEIRTGKKALISLMSEIVDANCDIYWAGSLEHVIRLIGESQFFKLMTWRRMGQNNTAYAITDKSISKYPRLSGQQGRFRKTKIVTDTFAEPVLYMAFANSFVVITIDNDNVEATILNNAHAANMFKKLFDFTIN